jgi:hypothetical protein
VKNLRKKAFICGEMAAEPFRPVGIIAHICGEMSPEDIPVTAEIDIAALKDGDTDPMEVVVEVPVSKSKRGWNYKPKALQDIVGEVMDKGLPGFLGHQKAENVGNEFPIPVTHWVGAKFDPNAIIKTGKSISKGAAYFRGIVDKSATDLKRWIRGKMVKEVSIFGMPQLQQVKGEIDVIGYAPLSIDWTPPGRAGMPTRIVSIGEMDILAGELDGSHEELRDALQAAVRELLTPDSKKGYAWIRRVFDEHVIVEHEDNGQVKLYQFPYSVTDDKVVLGAKTEVTRKEDYVPVNGEIDDKGGAKPNMKELLEKFKGMLASGEITKAQFIAAVGEMLGITIQEVTGEMAVVQQDAATLIKVREVLGVSGEMDVVAVAGEAGKALEAKRQDDCDKLIAEVLGEKVAGEMAQLTILEALKVPVTATKEQIAGEIDSLLAKDSIKALFSKMHLDTPVPGGNSGKDSAGGFARIESVSI